MGFRQTLLPASFLCLAAVTLGLGAADQADGRVMPMDIAFAR